MNESTEHIFGLHLFDWVAVIVYLTSITVIGWMTKSTIKTREDFFMAGRRFGKLLMIFHSFGAGTHTDHAVAVSGACYRNGISGIWAQWQWMFTTPFYWLLAPVFRRSRCITTADLFRDRFGYGPSLLLVMVSVISITMYMGIMLQGTGIVMESMTGGAVTQSTAVWIMTISFLIYGTAGGLVAAVVTDLIQGIFIIILSFLMVPFALWSIGGFEAIRANTGPHTLQLISNDTITIWVILLLSLNAMVSIVVQPQVMATTSAGKTEWEGRVGMTYGNFLKRICTLGWALIGVCAIMMYPGLPVDESEHVFGYAVADLLPIGVRGIMLASIMAAAMSTCDAFMVASSAMITENIYKPFLKPDESEKHYVTMGRIFSVIIVIAALFFSSMFSTVLEGAFTFFQITAAIGISFWIGILWRRYNSTGVFVSFVCAVIILYLAKFHWFTKAEFGVAPSIAYQTLCFIPAGVISGIIASLISKPLPQSITDAFFVKIHTPIGHEDRLLLPLQEAIPKQNRLVDCCGLLILKPSRESWLGFLIAVLIVILLIAGTQLLLSL